MNKIFRSLLPFFFLGMVIVMLIAGLILFSYLLIFGALVGAVLYIIALVRDKFFSSHELIKTTKKTEHQQGRIIDHDEKH